MSHTAQSDTDTTSTTDKPVLIVDMISDPVCPWCYIGKRSLDRAALALSLTHRLIIRYRPYQLAPEIPERGIKRSLYISRKFPDKTKLDLHHTAIIAAARETGLDLDPTRPTHIPNSLLALQMLRYAHEEKKQHEIAEAIFVAYWQDGDDIGDHDVIKNLAAAAGLEKENFLARLEDNSERNDIKDEVKIFRTGGVNGVPTYIINEREGFAGALPPDQLLTIIRDLAAQAPFQSLKDPANEIDAGGIKS